MNIPEILPCPNPECRYRETGDEVWTTQKIGYPKSWHVRCYCGYESPHGTCEAEAIRLHNAICRQPTPEAADAYMYSVSRVSPAGQKRLDTFAAIGYECQEGEELRGKYPLFAHPPKPEPTEEPVAWVLLVVGCKTGVTFDQLIAMAHESDGGTTQPLYRHPAAPKPPAEWMAQHKIIIESLAEIVRLCQCHPGGLKWREEMISREPVIAFVLRIRGAADAISDYLRHTPKVPEGVPIHELEHACKWAWDADNRNMVISRETIEALISKYRAAAPKEPK